MVSLDDAERNRAFAESLNAGLTLLSDPEGRAASAYGVTALGGLYARRWTFYIDREGVIRAIDKDVRVESAGQDIAAKLSELGFPRRSGRPESPEARSRPGPEAREPGGSGAPR